MSRWRQLWLLVPGMTAALLFLHAPQPLRSQEVAPSAHDVDVELDQARQLIKEAEYGKAVELLQGAKEELGNRVEKLREVYLLLIKAYEYLGNDAAAGRQGIEAAKPYYNTAQDLIKECLQTKDLRHAHPEPVTEYPEIMLRHFEAVRAEIFGSFRITTLEPAAATVTLDGDTLQTAPGDSLLGDGDLAVGKHLLVVRHPGYKVLAEEISIDKSTTLAREYRLSKKRGKFWYITRGTPVVAGLTAGAVALLTRTKEETKPLEPLPEPPPPPSR